MDKVSHCSTVCQCKYWKKLKRMVNILTIEYYATVGGRKRQREERREESELYKLMWNGFQNMLGEKCKV